MYPNDLPSLDLTNYSLSPTIDVPYLDTVPLNAADVADISGNRTVSPVANANQSGGFDINAVTNTLTSLFDSGVDVFNHIAKITGTPQLGAQTSTQAASPVIVAGFTQTQLWLIGGGIAFLGLIVLLRRR